MAGGRGKNAKGARGRIVGAETGRPRNDVMNDWWTGAIQYDELFGLFVTGSDIPGCCKQGHIHVKEFVDGSRLLLADQENICFLDASHDNLYVTEHMHQFIRGFISGAVTTEMFTRSDITFNNVDAQQLAALVKEAEFVDAMEERVIKTDPE